LTLASNLIFNVTFWWIIGKGAGTSWGNNFWQSIFGAWW
jgi:hypothetical protein